MTKIDDITKRFQRQAQGTEDADNIHNLADCVLNLKLHGSTFEMEAVWKELCQDFEILNDIVNNISEFHFSRSLLYAINGLFVPCFDCVASQRCNQQAFFSLLSLTWRINTAWDAVLAGDIASIEEHVMLEEAARGTSG